MKLYKTKSCILIEQENKCYPLHEDWDTLYNQPDIYLYLKKLIGTIKPISHGQELIKSELLPPIGSQEVWASGVTYYKSREARMEESKDAGGGDFYDRVYAADRPELFMKAAPHRVVGSGQKVRIRKDSKWNVPEPELTLAINQSGEIIGYAIGNDMSSRDIEGINPLYLPQAKSYDGAAAVGPCLWLTRDPIPSDTTIRLEIIREKKIFDQQINVSQIKRKFSELIDYLYREMTFPTGAFLMTGTGIVPPNDFTLDHGDEVRITIDHIGTLVNYVA